MHLPDTNIIYFLSTTTAEFKVLSNSQEKFEVVKSDVNFKIIVISE